MDAPATAAQAVEELNAAWQQSLEQLLGLNPGSLQLLQPPVPAPATSDALWTYFDAVPATGPVQSGPPAGASFAKTYGGVIMNLQPPSTAPLQKALGDDYAPWVAYLQTQGNPPAASLPALFRAWAAENIANPSIQTAGQVAITQMVHAPVPTAVRMYQAAFATGQPFAYTVAIDDFADALASAPSLSLSFDLPATGDSGDGDGSRGSDGGSSSGGSSSGGSSSGGSSSGGSSSGGSSSGASSSGGSPSGGSSSGSSSSGSSSSGGSSSGSSTRGPGARVAAEDAAEAAADGGKGASGTGGKVSENALTARVVEAGVAVEASFQRLVQLPAGPLAQTVSSGTLAGYTPWYNSAALSMAYQTSNNTLWNKKPPTWAQTFGPGGTLPRVCSGVVVADGIEITLTSPASLAADAQEELQSVAAAGVWPFFLPDGPDWTVVVSFDHEGCATVKVSSPAGNPQLLGLVVTPIQAALGLAS